MMTVLEMLKCLDIQMTSIFMYYHLRGQLHTVSVIQTNVQIRILGICHRHSQYTASGRQRMMILIPVRQMCHLTEISDRLLEQYISTHWSSRKMSYLVTMDTIQHVHDSVHLHSMQTTSSRYVRYLDTLVVAYGISINVVKVTWKSKLKAYSCRNSGFAISLLSISDALYYKQFYGVRKC